MRLKLGLINSKVNINEKIKEFKRKLKVSSIVAILIVSFYSVAVIVGIILEGKGQESNGLVIFVSKSITLSIMTVIFFYVMHKLRSEMTKFDQTKLK